MSGRDLEDFEQRFGVSLVDEHDAPVPVGETGDRGRMDSDGFVFFVDRLKYSIRRRGENISTWEIESTITLHETVLESAAYGVESDFTEQNVMFSVAPKPGHTIDAASLVEFCHGKISGFAVPRYVPSDLDDRGSLDSSLP